MYHLFVPYLCNVHFVLHAVYFKPRKIRSLYMPLIELCFGCWFGAFRHCCYLIMCCPHRHDCCYISMIYCVLPVGACGHYHHFIFVCYAMQVLPHAWVLPPLYTYIVLCTAGTATCVGAVAILYRMLCTASAATCVGTAAHILELCDAINTTQYRDTTMPHILELCDAINT